MYLSGGAVALTCLALFFARTASQGKAGRD
jgi:hypothetical protein